MGDHKKPIHFWHLRHFSCTSGASQVIDSDTAVSLNLFKLESAFKRRSTLIKPAKIKIFFSSLGKMEELTYLASFQY